jgi:hypothetical protein
MVLDRFDGIAIDGFRVEKRVKRPAVIQVVSLCVGRGVLEKDEITVSTGLTSGDIDCGAILKAKGPSPPFPKVMLFRALPVIDSLYSQRGMLYPLFLQVPSADTGTS